MSPRKAKRPCAYPGCPRLVAAQGPRYCAEHLAERRRAYDATRPSMAERGYPRNWRDISQRVLREYPVCQHCMRAPATLVHHIDGDPSNSSSANLIALCQPCHNQIHAASGELFGGMAKPGR